MASNVFPMLSSSPPPIDDCPDDDDEDDDEYGNFTSSNVPFDSSFDSPVAVEKFKSFKTGDNGVVNDANFSEIHKFNSFSNSNTPSPQEFVPNFSDENEHSKNGFKPIKSEKCQFYKSDIDITSSEDTISQNKIEVTSHKPVPLKYEHVLHSSSDTESSPFKDCDIHQKSEKNLEKEVLKDDVSGLNCFDEDPLSVCDSRKDNVIKELSQNVYDADETLITDNEPKTIISDSLPNNEFSKDNVDIDRISLDESCLPDDKFVCDFNFESGSNDEEFDDFQQSENVFVSNEALSSSLKSSDRDLSASLDKNSRKVTFKCCPEYNQISESVHEFSDDEFEKFQSCEKVTSAEAVENVAKAEDDFEYDDFQDFQYSSISKEETDDFQDFSTADTSCTDDFADFSAVPFDNNKTSRPSENSEFADFEEATFSARPEDSVPSASTSQKSVDTISTVINAIFPLTDSPQASDVSDEISPQILEQTNKSRRLWEKLHEVEQTPGLRFQWGVSHSFQQLLRSVNVDYHSILRTSSVPIFASGLSLLEPVKGLSNSVNHESEDRNQNPKDPIPPVEFDWNSSGLVNPLDFGQTASVLMDLSFLSSVDTETNASNNDHSFENELLKPSPAPLCPESSSKTQILEQLLSKNVSSIPNSNITHRPSDLSDEAVRVLDQLPDLSFMQAKVLMFPISNKT